MAVTGPTSHTAMDLQVLTPYGVQFEWGSVRTPFKPQQCYSVLSLQLAEDLRPRKTAPTVAAMEGGAVRRRSKKVIGQGRRRQMPQARNLPVPLICTLTSRRDNYTLKCLIKQKKSHILPQAAYQKQQVGSSAPQFNSLPLSIRTNILQRVLRCVTVHPHIDCIAMGVLCSWVHCVICMFKSVACKACIT